MKLNLNKRNIKSLSADHKQLPSDATPAIAGGRLTDRCSRYCHTIDIEQCVTTIEP
ncbi:hypothetical protein [Pseudoalteromonas rubra]|uniref:hypothetical protein n=1 Tax=Pseudoalteromonas rubra TaxID=43658 RepID=UPI0013DDC2EA|nr:hypothetical protein [Pseudoalteromonas rubra]